MIFTNVELKIIWKSQTIPCPEEMISFVSIQKDKRKRVDLRLFLVPILLIIIFKS